MRTVTEGDFRDIERIKGTDEPGNQGHSCTSRDTSPSFTGREAWSLDARRSGELVVRCCSHHQGG